MAWCIQGQVRRSRLTHVLAPCLNPNEAGLPTWQCSASLSSGLKDYGHLLALSSFRKAPVGVEHAFCLTPTDEDSHSATIVVLCFAIVCV